MKHYNHKRVIKGGWYKLRAVDLLPRTEVLSVFQKASVGGSHYIGDVEIGLYDILSAYESKGRFYWSGKYWYNVYFEKQEDAIWFKLKYGNS